MNDCGVWGGFTFFVGKALFGLVVVLVWFAGCMVLRYALSPKKPSQNSN